MMLEQALTRITDIKALMWLAGGQSVILVTMALKKWIEWQAHKQLASFDDHRDEVKRERATTDDLMRKLLEIEPMVRTTRTEVDLFRDIVIPGMRRDLIQIMDHLNLHEMDKKNGLIQ